MLSLPHEADFQMGDFYDELKRRNVLRIALACLASSWLLIQFVKSAVAKSYSYIDSRLSLRNGQPSVKILTGR